MSPVQVSNPNDDNIMSRKFVREKRLMDSITLLSDGTDNDRIDAANDIVKLLISKQNEIDDISKEMEYCLTRLIRGMASSKSQARLGFSLALIKILRHFEFLKVSYIHEIAGKVLTYQKTDSKSDKSNVKIGIVMLHIAIIQSGQLSLKNTPSREVFRTIEVLMKYKSDKKPLHLICTQTLCLLIKETSPDKFQENFGDSIEKQIADCTEDVDSANVLLSVVEYQPQYADGAFVKLHWNSSTVMNSSTLPVISKLYVASTLDHPVIHPFCMGMLNLALKQKISLFSEYWEVVVSKGLFEETIFRKYLAIHMICAALKMTSDPEQIQVILSKNSLAYIMHILTNQRHGLHTSILEFVRILRELTSDPNLATDFKIQIILCILSVPRSASTLEKNKTNLFTSLINKLDAETMVKLSELFVDCFYNNMTDTPDNEIDSSYTINNLPREWLATQLSNMVTSYIGVEELQVWRRDLLNFFFVNSYFQVNAFTKSIKHCSRAFVGSDELRAAMNLNFMKSLSKLATIHLDKKDTKDHEYFKTILRDSFSYAQELFNKSKVCEQINAFDEDTKSEWKNIVTVLANIENKKTEGGNHNAFELLFLHLGLHLFHTRSAESIDLLKDLHSCYNKACTKKKSPTKSAEEPSWVSVLTELLVSMLSENNRLARVIVNISFRILCPHVNCDSMKIILDVLKNTPQEDEEEDQIGFSSDGEDESEDEEPEEADGSIIVDETSSESDSAETEDSEATKATPKLNGKVADEESDVSDDDSSDEEVNSGRLLEMKSKIKNSLGDAIQDSDESELSDLSDSGMEKFDKAIVAVFKARNKESKDNKERVEQLKCFHLRVLDLLTIYVDHHPDTAILLQIIKPLLTLSEESKKDKATEEIANKSLHVLQQLTRPRKLIHSENIATEDLLEFLKELLNSVQVVSKPNFVSEISSICIFIIRVLHGTNEPVIQKKRSTRSKAPTSSGDRNDKIIEQIVNLFEASIIDFCSKRDSNMDHRLFIITLQRVPNVFWPLTEKLLKLACDADIRLFCRTQVCNMLSVMVTKHSVSDLEHWTTQAGVILEDITKSLSQFEDDNYKPRLVHNMLSLFSRTVMTVRNEDIKGLVTSDMVNAVDAIKNNAKVLKDTKSVCTRLKAYLGARLDLPKEELKEKSKKVKKQKLQDDDIVMNEEQLRLNKSKKIKLNKKKSEESKDDDEDDVIIEEADKTEEGGDDTNTPKKSKKRTKRKSSESTDDKVEVVKQKSKKRKSKTSESQEDLKSESTDDKSEVVKGKLKKRKSKTSESHEVESEVVTEKTKKSKNKKKEVTKSDNQMDTST